MGTSRNSFGRFVLRHRLYIFGAFAWVLTGSLIVTGLQWAPHAEGETQHPPVHIATTQKPAHLPQVAGAETTTPAPVTTTPKPTVIAKPVSTTVSNVITIMTSYGNGTTAAGTDSGSSSSGSTGTISLLPPATTGGTTTDPGTTPVTTPPSGTTTTPDPGTTTPPACTVDPALGFSILGLNAVTVVAGNKSAAQTLTTSDASSVTWTPSSAIVWGDGTTSDAAAPIAFNVSLAPGIILGSSLSYTVSAPTTTIPGTYSGSWRVTDTARSLCYDVPVQIIVVASI